MSCCDNTLSDGVLAFQHCLYVSLFTFSLNIPLSPAKSMDQIQNEITEMFVGWLSTKSVQNLPLHYTRWPPELKMERSLKKI